MFATMYLMQTTLFTKRFHDRYRKNKCDQDQKIIR